MIVEKDIKKKLDKIATSLNKLLEEVRESYPEAIYYVNSNTINIMLCESGNEEGEVLVDSKNIYLFDVGSW